MGGWRERKRKRKQKLSLAWGHKASVRDGI